LLSDQVDLLPRLLLPLAGPEEFDDEEVEKLPVDLQYLEPDKEREPDTDIRRLLVEAINQVCIFKAKFLFIACYCCIIAKRLIIIIIFAKSSIEHTYTEHNEDKKGKLQSRTEACLGAMNIQAQKQK